MKAAALSLIAAALLAVACAEAPPERISFTVEGMHCDSCSAAITDALAHTDGVESAWADHERGLAEAVYRPATVSPDQLAKSIEDLGYTVTAVHSQPVS